MEELTVISKAKELCDYVFIVTKKAPKQFRFTFVSKLQTYALAALEDLFRANEVRVTDERKLRRRMDYQAQALTELKLLGFIAELAVNERCILPKQFEQITKKSFECRNLLAAWGKSEIRRFNEVNT